MGLYISILECLHYPRISQVFLISRCIAVKFQQASPTYANTNSDLCPHRFHVLNLHCRGQVPEAPES